MDDIVKAALRKWPDVPACAGWLGLDARGDWYLRDAAVQARGAFVQVKGSRVEHAALRAFIGRNYESDDLGCWFFQNGPQRVFVELEAAPWVLGVWRSGTAGWQVQTHTERDFGPIEQVLLDERGRLFLACGGALGLVRSTDMAAAAEALAEAGWPAIEEVVAAELPRRFRYRLSPQSEALSLKP